MSATVRSNQRTKEKDLRGKVAREGRTGLYTVVKRNGTVVPFQKERVAMALEAAFRDTKRIPESQPLPVEVRDEVEQVLQLVVEETLKQAAKDVSLTVEGIQDLVEVKLMETGHHDVARDYIVYRDRHKKLRQDVTQQLKIWRRDGQTQVRFNPMKIGAAVESAFRETLQIEGATPPAVVEAVNEVTLHVVERAVQISQAGEALHVELIQDQIEQQLMEDGYFDVAKAFIIYRRRRAEERARRASGAVAEPVVEAGKEYTVIAADGSSQRVPRTLIQQRIAWACKGLKEVSMEAIEVHTLTSCYEGLKLEELDWAPIMAARVKIEEEPAYSFVAARLLLDKIYRETLGVAASDANLATQHKKGFKEYILKGIGLGRLAPELRSFNLDRLADAMQLERDLQFSYLGIQTLYDRYLIQEADRRIETSQMLWMRVAMGLSLNEGTHKNERAIEFYNILSRFLFVSATPTLFNAGTTHAQLSSCYLSTVMDDLHHIFKVVADDAQLSKWAGGIGNDWTRVRATGSLIRGTNGKSQGVVPFLKVANDTAVAVNQGGKRKGAMCAYLETWHLDIEDFIELRKNTGDERRRTHDMNTANWIPDLFMKRVLSNGMWTLFSPDSVPDLHDLYGHAFETRYAEYEAMVARGEIKLFKRVEAMGLWRKMLSMLFETGHPWITFKDPSNIRSPQDHVGVVHSSNLCTEILLNSSIEETAVCNLGSINLVPHTTPKGLDGKLLGETIRTAMRMLDNVIDINFYPTAEARTSNLRHRPIGMGSMGFQDALYIQGISYASPEAVEFSDRSSELIAYHAILASTELAQERGTYPTYKGSKWDRGLLPLDTINLLEEERGGHLDMDRSASLDWAPVRERVRRYGMRNSNTMAIAPTATISNIAGITQSIEPTYKHLFVKANLSGDFTIPNVYLVDELKRLGLWDKEMLDDLKYFDGSVLEIERVPQEIKRLFLTAFEIEPDWLIECASRRQKWLDMGQSLNLYMAEPSGKKLHAMYIHAWRKGLKTTYYLRSMSATTIEKSTQDINARGMQPRWMKNKSASGNILVDRQPVVACNLGEACEACQ